MRAAILSAILLPAALAAATPDMGPRAAREFVQAAAGSDAYERLAAAVVLTGSGDPQVRAFATRMVADHDATGQALARATAEAGLAPPTPSMGDDQAHLLAALQGVKGHDLDVAYARQQVLAHRSALTVEQDYAAHGDVASLRQAAAKAVPVISAHLDAAERLRAALEGS